MQNGAGAGDRIGGAPAFPWPKVDKPMMFWAQLGPEEISASGEFVGTVRLPCRPAVLTHGCIHAATGSSHRLEVAMLQLIHAM